jgi:hypothetical protein
MVVVLEGNDCGLYSPDVPLNKVRKIMNLSSDSTTFSSEVKRNVSGFLGK